MRAEGLGYDACTIYCEGCIQCSWSESWTLTGRHVWSDIVLPSLVDVKFNRVEYKLSQLVTEKIIYLSVTMKKYHALFHLTAMAVIIIGVLHMCFRSNHKSQAYVNFCKKIIYPSMSWYKACSKNTNICPLTQSYCKVKGKREESWDLLLCNYTIQWKALFWFKCMEPMSGPSSLDMEQHAITSQSST